jgi:hypothetical protein
VQYTRPEEHDLTFSWLNTYVIQTGVIFLLITDATGPLYGNGKYIFSSGELQRTQCLPNIVLK